MIFIILQYRLPNSNSQKLKKLKKGETLFFATRNGLRLVWSSLVLSDINLVQSKRLCKQPFCSEDYSNSGGECKFKCDNVIPSQARDVCLKKVPVIKTIRYCNLEELSEMLNEADLDPFFVFLVRDPRGIFNR